MGEIMSFSIFGISRTDSTRRQGYLIPSPITQYLSLSVRFSLDRIGIVMESWRNDLERQAVRLLRMARVSGHGKVIGYAQALPLNKATTPWIDKAVQQKQCRWIARPV